jgi:hypothetical protein
MEVGSRPEAAWGKNAVAATELYGFGRYESGAKRVFSFPRVHSPLITVSILKIQTAANPFLVADARRWTKILTPYRRPSELRSMVEITITFVPLAALWVLAWAALHFGYWWLSLVLAIPAAGFLVRLFMIQHDCGHGTAWLTIG